MTLRFRSAQLGDIPAITRLLGCLFAIEHDFEPDASRQTAALKLMLPREDTLLWVAEDLAAGLLGFCSVQTLISTAEGGPVGLVEDVVVAQAWRRCGIGRALLDGAELWARRRGCTRLQLLADAGNLPALDFYRRQGWQETRLNNWRKRLA